MMQNSSGMSYSKQTNDLQVGSGIMSTSYVQQKPAQRLKSFGELLPPAKPIASNSYSDYLSPFLKGRLKHMYVLILVWIFLVSATQIYLFNRDANFYSISYEIFTWIAMIPIVVCHKAYRTTTANVYPSKIVGVWKSLSSKRSYTILAAYIVSGFVGAIAFTYHIPFYPRDNLSPFLYTPKNNKVFFNEKFAFFATAGAFAGFVHGIIHIMKSPEHYNFPERQHVPIWQRIFSIRGLVVYRSAVFETLLPSFFTWIIVHFMFGRLNYRVFTQIVRLTRPFRSIMIYHEPKIGLYNWLRCGVMFSTLGLVWGVVDMFIQVYFSQPLLVSELAPDMYACILDGMKSSDEYIRSLAFYEISRYAEISDSDWDWRKELYQCVNADKNVWKDISRECMMVIGKAAFRFKNNGKEYESQIIQQESKDQTHQLSSAQLSEKAKKVDGEFKKLSVSSGGVVQRRHFSDIFKGIDTSAQDSNTKSQLTNGYQSSIVPSVFQPVTLNAQKSSNTQKNPAMLNPILLKQVQDRIFYYVLEYMRQDTVGRAWIAHTIERKAINLSRDGPLQIHAITTLSNLIFYSLTEDVYGTVQKDIPRGIEVLTRYLISVEYWLQHLPIEPEDDRGQTDAGKIEVEEIIGPLQHAALVGLERILSRFWDYLDQYSFPPDVQKRLQRWIDTGL